MSMWDFFDKTERTARKPYRCAEAGCAINPGDRYADCRGKVEGQMDQYRLCLTCDLITTEATIAYFDEGFPLGETRAELRSEFGIEDPVAWATKARDARLSQLHSLRAAQRAQQVRDSIAAEILIERERQISAEGWTPEHDDGHVDGELARAASAYALLGARDTPGFEGEWPRAWGNLPPPDKPPRRALVIAGALILAEIERIDRAAAKAAEAESQAQ